MADKDEHMLTPDERLASRYGYIIIIATVDCEGKTGVEMEAMTAASVAGLTMYDMLKGVDKAMYLTNVRVIAKSGGKSGDWKWSKPLGTIVPVEELKESEEQKEARIQANVRERQHEIDNGKLVSSSRINPNHCADQILRNTPLPSIDEQDKESEHKLLLKRGHISATQMEETRLARIREGWARDWRLLSQNHV